MSFVAPALSIDIKAVIRQEANDKEVDFKVSTLETHQTKLRI